MYPIQISQGGFLGISDDLINFLKEEFNKMADRGHFEKIATQKAGGCDILWPVGWIIFKFHAVVL